MLNISTYRSALLILMSLIILSGCAGVKTVSVSTNDYMSQRRGDILTTGEISSAVGVALQVVGINEKQCRTTPHLCRSSLANNIGLDDEQRMSALAELWLQEALTMDKKINEGILAEDVLNAYLETARHAYAYLFLTPRSPSQRALEDRQTQVRDYYNFAVQQMVARTFNHHQQHLLDSIDKQGKFSVTSKQWQISGQLNEVRLADGQQIPEKLIPASSLTFKGLRNQYRRDGVGAELVAVTAKRVVNKNSREDAFSETPFPAVTAVLRFPGDTLEEVLDTKNVELLGFDPYRRNSVNLAGVQVPLAANFTSGYGLWLARSGFAKQSLLTLVGRGEVLEQPRVYLMQPYDPNRRVIIMLHGLASSPEAWINVANEVLGDETLRKNYQIWQVYYPTNAPLTFNQHAIRQAIQETLQAFDSNGNNRASKDVVLIGHSMGGVLARLLISESGDAFWKPLVKLYGLEGDRKEKARKKLKDYVWFKPMPQASRAVFIAAPHRGTPFAENRFSRWAAGVIKLPVSMLGRMTEIAQLLVDPSSASGAPLTRPLNSISNLSDQDPFVRLAANLPISNYVPYHSIIGNDTPDLSLEQSSDGVVPYKSSHLAGAQSEKVIRSWHSVQETPEAIVEVRRILHTHLHNTDGFSYVD
ncbi:MAG TPA: alpha/beta fold hydrolase [Thiopseudomonas sp.]|nr:alpha/beta fold hydrolase [Thiopseudomonas sp.]